MGGYWYFFFKLISRTIFRFLWMRSLRSTIEKNKTMNIRNWQCTSSISTQWSIRFINSLLEPTNKLSPYVLAIVFFGSIIGWLALTKFVHAGSFRMANVTIPNVYFVAFAFLVRFCLSEEVLCIRIHHKNVTHRWYLDLLRVNAS